MDINTKRAICGEQDAKSWCDIMKNGTPMHYFKLNMSSGTTAWSGVTTAYRSGVSDADIRVMDIETIPDNNHGPPKVIIQYVDRPVPTGKTETVYVDKPIIKTVIQKEIIYMNWNLGNILIVALICIITMALVKKITLKVLVKAVVKIIVWPFAVLTRKAYREARTVWAEEESKEEAEQMKVGRKAMTYGRKEGKYERDSSKKNPVFGSEDGGEKPDRV